MKEPPGIAWVDVPGGAFAMGLTSSLVDELLAAGSTLGLTPERIEDEYPAHEQQVASFQMAKTPVTNQQYAEFIEQGGYADQRLFRKLIQDVGAGFKKAVAEFVDETGTPGPSTWCHGQFAPGTEDHPVSGVSFYEAAACAQFFDARLPQECEWEYAARHPDGRLLPWGNTMPGKEIANFRGQNLQGTSPVGAQKLGVSALGFCDLAGNVHEWTNTVYAPYPGGVVRYRFGAEKTARVARGGAFDGEFWDLRTTSRFGVNARLRFAGLGFRLAR